jgi:hypothetical protein
MFDRRWQVSATVHGAAQILMSWLMHLSGLALRHQ